MEQWQYWTGSVPLDFSHYGLVTTISTFAFLPLWNEGVCINDPTSRLPLYVDYVRGRWWGFLLHPKTDGWTGTQDCNQNTGPEEPHTYWDLIQMMRSVVGLLEWDLKVLRWVSFVNRCPDVTNHASHTSSINIAPIHINVLDFSS